ncbi:cold-shock DNA-binding domain protein (macronuclear) [Tetrahymena thermophila SB210]|uniref:Cold-shock DNA-binding domain protein n=1 Tax=Tetrahymena thermophila (strain SB210) TaxID=312017 RepID=I7LWQ7_TETTS|nr:cold-shock DNA-binding domain protein [Tetrahymena thermophila SB210]EAS02667.2 cold-shock DNA-binding domain protein [Tetrahymena thermophila SB210]|eukprot:XP_001022912.2 cold-shock DNA-binding domain protein [Tetrahymena thermophila SB210]
MDFNSSLLQEALLKIQNQRDQPQVINSTIKNLLHSNNLAIRPIPEGGSNLMRAVSDCLYFTTSKYQEIQALCFKYFQKLFQQKKLTRTLEKFYHNFQLLSDYCNNPELSIFDDVNLEVVSMIYKVKVIVFSVGDDSYLNSKQFNSKNHTKIIQLLWDDGIYTPVYDEQFLDHAKMAQNLVYEILGKVIEAELVNPDHDFVHLEFQHQQDKENKRESRKSPYKFPAPTEGLQIKRSFSQQNLKELDQDKEKSNDKEFSAQVGYHNLKTANERIMTQSNKQQKHFTFNLNECNDEYEQPPAEDSKRQFFTEFLDPWTNLLLHQNEESQECAPISPVGYKQFMYIQMQQQQQINAYNYTQYQVPQIPPIYQPYPNAAPSPLPNPYTTQPPPTYNYFASPYPHYEDFAQPPPQMQADYQHVSEAWYATQQQQMHHYPYQVRYQEQNQIRYLPQQQQQQGQQQQGTNAQPPFAPINTNPIEPYKNRIVIPQPIEQQPQQQQTIIGNIYYHSPNQAINQGIPPTNNISNIGQQSFISTPPLPQNLPPAIIHQTQPSSIDNLTVLIPPDRVVNNINQNVIGRKQPIQQNYTQQSNTQFSNFNTSINDVHNITSLLDNDNIYHPQQIPNDNQQVFFRQSSQPQQQQNINFNMPYRQQQQQSEQQQLQSQGSSDEAQKQRQFSQKNYGLNSNSNNNQNNKQTYNQSQNVVAQNNPSNNYQQNNFKMSNQSKIPNDKIQKESKNNNTFNNNKMNPHLSNNSNSNINNNTNNQSFNTNYNNNTNNYNNNNNCNNNNSSNNNNSNSIGSSKNLQKQKIPNSNSIGSSNNIEDQKDPQKMKEPKKPEVLEQTEEKKKGRLKFFDTSNNFGFFNLDEDQSDVFVHLDDLQVTTVPKDILKHSSLMNLRFKFHFIKYIGKHKQSRKAVDIEYIPEESEETILPQFANVANSQSQETNSQSSKNTSSNTLNSVSSLSPDKKVRKGPNTQNYKPSQAQQSYQNSNNNANSNDNNNQYQFNNFKGQPPVNNNSIANQNNYNSNNSYNPNNHSNNQFNGSQYQKRNSYNNNNNINNGNPNNNYNYNNNNPNNNNYNSNFNNNNNNNFINNNNYKHYGQKTYPQNNGVSQRTQQY